MEREILIGIAFILIGAYLIVFRKWLAANQAKWASERGGLVEKNVNSISPTGHERNALIIGLLLLCAGSVVIFRGKIDFRSLVDLELIAWGFFGLGIISFGHAVIFKRTKWSVVVATFLLLLVTIFLISVVTA
ncbi:hypothetical protein [Roseovarius rhodophyticola]|uniref:DUF3784 domain-containing protein n=1 Tax=Roseovarius rhodophyticola TaxID=3080827 RepID=A0ABZ2TJV0_9RHOB|nr:hypothetical protein [Roseovarius sp. W115]MDV2930164.1 hypothetical protein [Roseovarius sp. W115]